MGPPHPPFFFAKSEQAIDLRGVERDLRREKSEKSAETAESKRVEGNKWVRVKWWFRGIPVGQELTLAGRGGIQMLPAAVGLALRGLCGQSWLACGDHGLD